MNTGLRFIQASAIFLSSFVVITACTQRKPDSKPSSESADIFSNRPIGAVPDVFVVTLNAPPILQAGTHTANGWIVSDAVKNAILDEQAQFESKLKNLAPQAQIVFRYHMTLNGLAIYAPAGSIAEIKNLPGVKSVSPVRQMERAEILNESKTTEALPKAQVNSATFIGAQAAYDQGFRGQGMRVGIIDTGIDYTHSMLGGSGNKADYAAVNPAQPSPFFPNKKVAGGVDLAGSDFNAASPFNDKRLPHPDSNPLDEAGHGTHVAGTVAGIGDGINSYNGVAPDAQVYAIKVFGKQGSTMDAVVIAGFEYAADPNGDLNPNDQLDVVNLSLGGGFGQPQILYSEAVRNLSRGGTFVVASAGNSGPVDYIVGAPGTSDEALSIAASIDGSPHNWRFPAVQFISPSDPHILVKATEGPISKPIKEAGPVEGELFNIGLADVDLTPEQVAGVTGKVALIVRGKVSFAEKLGRAFAAGAIGAVVYNSEPGNPIPMGGEGRVEIPAIMVSQAFGMNVIAEMAKGPVRIQFQTNEMIEQPELVDSITDFSSKGPRSEDNLLKPEIAAPGSQVISAAMGEGTAVVKMDGTSMAAPHMTGAMALIKQARPQLNSSELKALVMNTSKVLTANGAEVPISLQGAGRVQIDKALASPIALETPSISLGSVYLETTGQSSRTITVRNLTAQDLNLTVDASSSPGLSFAFSKNQIVVPANGTADVEITANYTMADIQNFASELDGRIFFRKNGVEVAQLPALAIRTQSSAVKATSASVGAGVTLSNNSPVDGMALAFNLLGEDKRKADPAANEAWKSKACDLQSVGYRIIPKATKAGVKDFAQFAFKMYSPLTTWHLCEVSVLIDANGDGVADQELAGVSGAGVEGIALAPFLTILLDSVKARSIRLEYEMALNQGVESKLDYMPAALAAGSMAPFSHSTLAVIEIPVENLAKSADGKLNVKVASLNTGGDALEADDYLGDGLAKWTKIESTASALPFYGMDEFSEVKQSAGAQINLQRGSGQGQLIMYYPMNGFNSVMDNQSQILN